MPTSDVALEFSHVSKKYEGKQSVLALDDISLSIAAGEIFGIVGESGSGKSTFLDLSIGLEHATTGSVRVFGTELASLSERELQSLRKTVGVVFQGNNLLSNITVRANVELPLRLSGKRDAKRVTDLLGFVGLSHRGDHYPAELSGGERQRVAIARALMTNPRMILFDEPTSALDVSTRHDILRLILDTQEEFGTTCVLVSHELDAVKAVCTRAALFERGKLREIVAVNRSFTVEQPPYLDHAKGMLSE